jgi:hypothetical protein
VIISHNLLNLSLVRYATARLASLETIKELAVPRIIATVDIIRSSLIIKRSVFLVIQSVIAAQDLLLTVLIAGIP